MRDRLMAYTVWFASDATRVRMLLTALTLALLAVSLAIPGSVAFAGHDAGGG